MEKLDYYHEYPCKWLTFCLNVEWPIIIAISALFALISIFSWTSTSLAILIPCMIQVVVLTLCDALVRSLDKTAFKLWYVGHATPVVCNIISIILFAVLQTNSAMNLTSLSDALTWGIGTAFAALYSGISMLLAHDFFILFIVNAVYISARKNLFYYSYKKLRRLSAETEDIDDAY